MSKFILTFVKLFAWGMFVLNVSFVLYSISIKYIF